MLPITDDEWDAAHRNTSNSDDPKIPHTLTRQGSVRHGYAEEHDVYKTKSSFLYFSNAGRLFGMRKGDDKQQYVFAKTLQQNNMAITLIKNDAIIGSGTFGQVRRMIDQYGYPSVVKIQKQHDNARIEEIRIRKRARESAVLEDLNESVGTVSRVNKKNIRKYYTHMIDRGRSLLDVLKTNASDLDNDRRMRIAINACLAVVDLHYLARKSVTKTRYAHLDIKAQNFTIDGEDRVSIVDYGACKKSPQTGLRCSYGTRIYAPPVGVQLKKWQFDVLALFRTLIFPTLFVAANQAGRVCFPSTFSQEVSILTPSLIAKYNLHPFFDTSIFKKESRASFEQDDTTSLLACAFLINQYYHLEIPVQTLKNNSFICLIIIDLYMNGCAAVQMRDTINELIQKESLGLFTPDETTNKALQISRILNLPVDNEEIQQSGELARLVVKLERLGLVHHVHKIRRSSRLNELMNSDFADPAFFNQLNLLLEELSADSEHFNRIIDMFFDQRELADILINNQLIRAFQATIFSEDQIQLLTQYNNIGLTPFEFHRSAKLILNNPELTRIVISIIESQTVSARKWILKIGAKGAHRKEKVALYVKAANILIDQKSSNERFTLVINTLIDGDLDNTDNSKSLLTALVHLLEKNLFEPPIIKMAKENDWYHKFIVSLCEKGLGNQLESILKHSRYVLSVLNSLLQKQPLEFFESVLNDRALFEKIDRLHISTVDEIIVHQFLIREQFECNFLSSTQTRSVLGLIPVFNRDDEALRMKIKELIQPQRIYTGANSFRTIFYCPTAPSNSSPLSQPGSSSLT